MRTIFRLVVMGTAGAALSSCGSIEGKDPNAGAASDYNRPSYEQQGGAAVETAIWSNDPKKKTLPKAIGDGLSDSP